MNYDWLIDNLNHVGQNDERRGEEDDDGGERGAEPDAGLLEPVHLLKHQTEATGRHQLKLHNTYR